MLAGSNIAFKNPYLRVLWTNSHHRHCALVIFCNIAMKCICLKIIFRHPNKVYVCGNHWPDLKQSHSWFEFQGYTIFKHDNLVMNKYTIRSFDFKGNGPSGIALSFMLAGNWPYWNVDELRLHPDELLRARLNCAGSDESLVQQDLEMLADGLEGRSTNPVSLLVRRQFCRFVVLRLKV